ncbi:MAG: N-acetylglucosamine-6-phosphate deacetylase [Opitutaceae bacterium]
MSHGLFDLQVNGFAGVDFQRPEITRADLDRAAEALRRHQTTGILFTLITDTIDALAAQLERVERFRAESASVREMIAGYHIEGPYLLPEPGYHGAHDPRKMKAPDRAEFDRLQRAAGGRIRLVTLAPEWPGSPDFIRHLVASGVTASIGHSNADDRAIDAAVAAGLTMCTHVGNGVPQQMHRHDNIIQRVLARDELTAVFIPDGIHVPPGVLRNFVRAKPRAKVLFTTDCMAAAGAPPGRYTVGHIEVEAGAGGVVREPGKPNFAGSSLAMDAAVANIRRFLGWTEAEAVHACGEAVRAALKV